MLVEKSLKKASSAVDPFLGKQVFKTLMILRMMNIRKSIVR